MSTVARLAPPEHDYPAESGYALPGEENPALGLRRMMSALRRRKFLIFGIVLVGTSLSALFVYQITPLYKAKTRIVVERPREKIVNIDAVAKGIRQDMMTAQTQAAIIASRELAAKTVERLDLENHPLFNPKLRKKKKPGLVKLVTGTVTGFLSDVVKSARELFEGAETPKEEAVLAKLELPPEEKAKRRKERLISAFLGGLKVKPAEKSRVITITYTSTDRRFAAIAANAVAETYIEDQRANKGSTTVKAFEFLSKQVKETRTRLVESERRLAEFRKKAGIVEIGESNQYQAQLARLNEELTRTQSQRAEADARYEQLQKVIREKGGIESALAVLDSPLIQNLREQEARVARKIAELKTQYRSGHPRLRLAYTEQEELQKKIQAEIAKIAANLDGEVQIAKARERNIQKQIAEIRKLLEAQNGAEVTLRSLESEVQANKRLYETLLSRLEETKIQRDDVLTQPDARIISRATTPSRPFYPNTRMMILAAFVVSLVLGIGLVLLLELLDSGFRSLSQVEAETGMPTLGLVPLIPGRGKKKLPHQVILEKPNSTFGEAVRTLRTTLLLAAPENRQLRTVAVTSAVPGEGKTSTALALACTVATSGQQAIIIDCDLRHASVHAYLGLPNRLGLSDYLSGQAKLEEVIQNDAESGLYFISAGTRAPNPVDLLGSVEMKELLAYLAERFDLVVLDTPPILPVSDSLVLVRAVEKTIFLVRWEKTRRETAMAGLKHVLEAGADVAGIVLAQVDVRKHAQYDYSDSGYYYQSSYKHYYVE